MWGVGLGPEKVRESCFSGGATVCWAERVELNVNNECRLSDSALGQQIALGRTVQPCQPTEIRLEYDTTTGTHRPYHTPCSA
jgi:hypothetical protein